MDDNIKIFLDLDENTIEAFESNQVKLQNELKQFDIDVNEQSGVLNLESSADVRTKDIVPILIAATSSVAAISYAISSIISALNGKTATVVLESLVELRDSKNEVVLGTDGMPVFKTVKTVQVIDAAKKTNTEFEIELFKVFKLKIISK
nr:hypothetical protein [uncultured Mucilaginibacter sp.]